VHWQVWQSWCEIGILATASSCSIDSADITAAHREQPSKFLREMVVYRYIASGVIGIKTSGYAPWCEDESVSVIVKVSRAGSMAILTVGSILALLVSLANIPDDEDKIVLPMTCFAVACASLRLLQCANVLLRYGNCCTEVVIALSAGERRDEHEDYNAGCRFSFFFDAYNLVLYKNANLEGLLLQGEPLLLRHIPHNWRLIASGSMPDRIQGLFSLVVLDGLLIIYLSLRGLCAVVEAVVVSPGALFVELQFAGDVQYQLTTTLDPSLRIRMKDLLTCEDCRYRLNNGHRCKTNQFPSPSSMKVTNEDRNPLISQTRVV
jgi:hypothetical protein